MHLRERLRKSPRINPAGRRQPCRVGASRGVAVAGGGSYRFL